MASVCSSVWQSQGSPFAVQKPWPNCVILQAVQLQSGKPAIKLATTDVLPTLRECPPTTTTAIYFLNLARVASSFRYSRTGFAGVPQNTIPGPNCFFFG